MIIITDKVHDHLFTIIVKRKGNCCGVIVFSYPECAMFNPSDHTGVIHLLGQRESDRQLTQRTE